MNEQEMTPITLKFGPTEIKALQDLAKQSKCTLEEAATRSILIELIKQGVLDESAERNGKKIVRLDE